MKNKLLVIISSIFMAIVFSGCYEPSPLYGKWADNAGEYITFINDGSFVSKLNTDEREEKLLEGTYTVIDNVLIFSVAGGTEVSTEWDIRGSILYLTWNDNFITERNLTLYHVSK